METLYRKHRRTEIAEIETHEIFKTVNNMKILLIALLLAAISCEPSQPKNDVRVVVFFHNGTHDTLYVSPNYYLLFNNLQTQGWGKSRTVAQGVKYVKLIK